MRNLLMYLWQNRGESISEYAIAVEALGRAPDFDPKTDSTVRVQIARLRAKLKSFHEAAGEGFPLELSIPLGSHELVYTYSKGPSDQASWLAQVPRRYVAAVACGFALLAAVSVLLYVELRSLRASLPPAPPELPRFWKSFLASGKPTLVVLPSPQVFYWPRENVYIRDLTVSTFERWLESPLLKELAAKWGPPESAQTYVGAMEMTGGVRVLQYLNRYTPDLQMIESRKFSVEAFADRNIIFLGMPRTTAGYLDRLLGRTNFYLASVTPDVVRSRQPGSEETVEYTERAYSPDRRIYPSIIMRLPVRPEGTQSVIILGRNLIGPTTMLTSLEGNKAIEDEVEKNGRPDAWEMVIESEIFRDTVLKARPVAFRALPANFWNELN